MEVGLKIGSEGGLGEESGVGLKVLGVVVAVVAYRRVLVAELLLPPRHQTRQLIHHRRRGYP